MHMNESQVTDNYRKQNSFVQYMLDISDTEIICTLIKSHLSLINKVMCITWQVFKYIYSEIFAFIILRWSRETDLKWKQKPTTTQSQ